MFASPRLSTGACLRAALASVRVVETRPPPCTPDPETPELAVRVPVRSPRSRPTWIGDAVGRHAPFVTRRERGRAASFVFVVKAAAIEYARRARVPEWYKPPQDLPIRDWPFPEPYLAAASSSMRTFADRRRALARRLCHEVSLFGSVAEARPLRFHPRTHRDPLTFSGRSERASQLHGASAAVRHGARRTTRMDRCRCAGASTLGGGALRRTRARTVEGARRKIDALARRWGIDASAVYRLCRRARSAPLAPTGRRERSPCSRGRARRRR